MLPLTLKQSPTHEGHESLPEEQRSTQQKVVLFQTLSYLVSSHSEVSVLNIRQSTSTLHCQIFGLKYDERDRKRKPVNSKLD
jgi:hypothetical protein